MTRGECYCPGALLMACADNGWALWICYNVWRSWSCSKRLLRENGVLFGFATLAIERLGLRRTAQVQELWMWVVSSRNSLREFVFVQRGSGSEVRRDSSCSFEVDGWFEASHWPRLACFGGTGVAIREARLCKLLQHDDFALQDWCNCSSGVWLCTLLLLELNAADGRKPRRDRLS